MNLESMEGAWQTGHHGRITVELPALVKQIRRSASDFRNVIFWRDVREVGICLIMLPYWLYSGIKENLPWTWYLAIPAMLWVAGFILIDGSRQRRREGKPGESLKDFLDHSIAQVEHQIWLLRNVFWWYVLPFALAINAFLIHSAWNVKRDGNGTFAALLFAAFALSISLLISWGVYRLNQCAVKADLLPRRNELEELRRSLQSEA